MRFPCPDGGRATTHQRPSQRYPRRYPKQRGRTPAVELQAVSRVPVLIVIKYLSVTRAADGTEYRKAHYRGQIPQAACQFRIYGRKKRVLTVKCFRLCPVRASGGPPRRLPNRLAGAQADVAFDPFRRVRAPTMRTNKRARCPKRSRAAGTYRATRVPGGGVRCLNGVAATVAPE